jgi:hypothetical protein
LVLSGKIQEPTHCRVESLDNPAYLPTSLP